MTTTIGKEMPTQLLLCKGAFDPSISIFDLTGMGNNKPRSAVWTSSLLLEEEGAESAWTQWCSFEMPQWLAGVRKYIIKPKDDVKILEINGEEDLDGVPLVRSPFAGISPNILDFSRIVELGFSAIHLTEEGARVLHWGSTKFMVNFNPWDVESSVWLRPDCFASVREI